MPVESFTESAYLAFVLVAAIGLLAFGLVAATSVWQSGRTERQRMGIEWEREKLTKNANFESKKWADAVSAVDTKLEPLLKQLDKLTTDVARLQGGRVEIKKVG